MLFSRALHWYCHIEYYRSFWSAMTDYSTGSFVLPGVLLGTWAAAALVRRTGLAPSTGGLLDAAAPGMAVVIALIRFSAIFNRSCRGRPVITDPAFQGLPFGAAMTDAAGNVDYRFATFFVEFLLMLAVAAVLLLCCLTGRRRPMKGGRAPDGNVARLFLLLYGGIEIVMDSTRYDSHLMHFTLIKRLNPYASFISVAQIVAAVTILCVFIYFLRLSVKENGFRPYHAAAIALYAASLVGAGYFGEYRVQRTGLFLQCYTVMTISVLVMLLAVGLICLTCVDRTRPAQPAEQT